MSYWLEDADGKYLGDLATNVGINQLRDAGSPALKTFLDQGFADEDLIEEMVNESLNNPKLSYIAAMFDEVKAPVYVTDGCGQADEVENKSKPILAEQLSQIINRKEVQ
jgi:hypothetical protein